MSEDDRIEPPLVADERATLDGFLDYQRATLAWKCADLTEAQLREQPIKPSTLSLLGLIRHVTDVELHWFQRCLSSDPAPYHYWTTSGADPDFNVDEANVTEAFTTWTTQCEKSREQSAALPLEATVEYHDEEYSHRWILTHMIEEYARHNGHADLLREQLDGTTGE